MNFTGLAAPLSPSGLQFAADLLGVDLPTLWAVASVETLGCGFFQSRRPQILFERHVFSGRTDHRFDADQPQLSNPVAGGYDAPTSDQYVRLEDAMALDAGNPQEEATITAALESASWGIGQVMGFNAQAAVGADVRTMIDTFKQGEDAQLQGAANFIDQKVGLAAALQAQDWATFARGYNGPAFAQRGYDVKLRLAHARYSAGVLPDLHVRAIQLGLMLCQKLQPSQVDGFFGHITQTALLAFQQDEGLPPSGKPDDATVAALIARVGWAAI